VKRPDLTRSLAGAGAALLLGGCVAPPGAMTNGQPGLAQKERTPFIAPAERRVVMEAARAGRIARERTTHLDLVAIPVSAAHGCRYVTLRERNFRRDTHYAVCHGTVTRRAEVAPARLRSQAERATATAVARDAWAHGRATARLQGYRYIARRVGPGDGRGCARVETRIDYDGLLVDRESRRVCRPN
jgi:hypothetical protein